MIPGDTDKTIGNARLFPSSFICGTFSLPCFQYALRVHGAKQRLLYPRCPCARDGFPMRMHIKAVLL